MGQVKSQAQRLRCKFIKVITLKLCLESAAQPGRSPGKTRGWEQH